MAYVKDLQTISLSWHLWCDATLLTAVLLITENEIPVENSHTSPLILFRFVYQSVKFRKGCNLANLFLVAEDTRIQSYSAIDYTSGWYLTAPNCVSSSRSLGLNETWSSFGRAEIFLADRGMERDRKTREMKSLLGSGTVFRSQAGLCLQIQVDDH